MELVGRVRAFPATAMAKREVTRQEKVLGMGWGDFWG